MKTYDLYSLDANNLEIVKESLEQRLGLVMKSHESSYHGGKYYRFGALGEEHFILQRNVDLEDEEAVESKVPKSVLLLYVNETTRSIEIEQMLKHLSPIAVLVRREYL